jgi:alpha-galactosidase
MPAMTAPRINHPRIHGARPGKPFLFTVPISGARPLTVTAAGLPSGLAIDAATGAITGRTGQQGRHRVVITATNAHGSDTAEITLAIGETLCLTPPMGWNSWNCFGDKVTQAQILAAAEALAASGLAQHGYQYVNIDDGWQGERGADGAIRPHAGFPDLPGLIARIHALGLKAGIYSSPGRQTCARFAGSLGHEAQDARTYADWGVDFLKYDHCSYFKEIDKNALDAIELRAAVSRPYRLMRACLDAVDRDIVYSLCQYGLSEVWEWGAEAGGNLWRTTGDITDSWASMSGIGFAQHGLERHARPGAWNDPDMLVVGRVGWGQPRPTRLTRDEQITHLSLWAMLAAPLLIGCDLTALDDGTLRLLTNDEVIAIDQDPLGRAGRRALHHGTVEIWLRELAGGERALAVFNREDRDQRVETYWIDANVTGRWQVRDVWAQADLGVQHRGMPLEVPAHGARLLRMVPA